MTNKSKIVDGIRYVQCGKCKRYKPLDSFHKLKHGRYGVQSECKKCSEKRVLNWIEKNHKKYVEYHRALYRKRCDNDSSFREKINQRSREWRKRNPCYLKEWFKNNPDYQRERRRKLRKENPGHYKKLRQTKTA